MASKQEQLKISVEADDNASAVLSDVADKVDGLDGETAEVEITAEDKATADVDTLMKRIESLTDDQKRIVLEAEASKAERVIDKTIKALGQVDGDRATAVIDAKDQADAKLSALRDELVKLDGDRFEPTVDVRGAGQARQEVRDVADTAQSGIGPLRGFTDELGESSQKAGVWGNAIIDAGETIQIFGAKAGLSDKALSRISGALATAGIAIAAGMIAWSAYNSKQDETRESTQATIDALTGIMGVIGDVKDRLAEAAKTSTDFGDAFTAALLESMDDGNLTRTTNALADLNLGFEDLGASIRKLEDDNYEVTGSFEGMADILRNSGVDEYTDEIAQAIHQGENWDAITAHLTQNLINSGMSAEEAKETTERLTAAYGDQINAAEELNDQQQRQDYIEVAESQLAIAKATDEATRAFLAEWEAAHPDATALETWEALREHQLALGESLVKVTGGYEAVKGPAYDAAAAAEESALAAEEAAQAYRDELTASLEDATEALEENTAALDEQYSALRASVDAQYALDDATETAADKLTAYNEAVAEHGETSEEATDALDDYRESVTKAVDAEIRLAEETAAANGQSLSRVQRLNAENAAYINQARTVDGPAREAILRHVAAINGIPPERVTDILTDAVPNDIAQVEAELNGLTKARTAAVNADANDASLALVQTQIAIVARGKTVQFTGEPNFAKVWGAVDALKHQTITFGGSLKGRATGDPNWEGGPLIVGEDGPEIVDLPRNSEITPNHRLDTRRGRGDSYTYNVTMNMPPGIRSDDAAAALRRQLSIQGPY